MASLTWGKQGGYFRVGDVALRGYADVQIHAIHRVEDGVGTNPVHHMFLSWEGRERALS
jgi:hypothetical protein